MIAKRFYTGPRFRRHIAKPDQFKKLLAIANEISDPVGRAVALAVAHALQKITERKAAL